MSEHPKRALAEYRRLLQEQTLELGPDDPESLATRYKIALILLDNSFDLELEDEPVPSEAGVLQAKQLLDDQVRVLGSNHPDTFRTRSLLAWFYQDDDFWMGWPESIRNFRQLVRETTHTLGINHPVTIEVHSAFGRFLIERVQFKEALEGSFAYCLQIKSVCSVRTTQTPFRLGAK